MNSDSKHDLEGLQNHIDRTQDLLKKAGDPAGLIEIKKIIVKPGWTTPAEMRMTLALLDSIGRQAEMIAATKIELVKSAQLVGTAVHA